ncbi:hypothetical protein [Methanosphaera sp.]|uniref:hypothetical protein n=1 Tax=Methanosphaera sp. TaxID=2666342 RepID=UPI0025E6BB32|nr:hypothetical protein [Methanosphaera sp.]
MIIALINLIAIANKTTTPTNTYKLFHIEKTNSSLKNLKFEKYTNNLYRRGISVYEWLLIRTLNPKNKALIPYNNIINHILYLMYHL